MSNLKKRVAELMTLADETIKAATKADLFKEECSELRSETERLASLLRDVAKVISSGGFYDRPALHALDQSHQVMEQASEILLKCVPRGVMARFFSTVSATSFCKIKFLLRGSIDDLRWLLQIWLPSDEYPGLPPMASNVPIQCFVWELIAALHHKVFQYDPSDDVISLISLSQDNHVDVIIEEGGIEAAMKVFSVRVVQAKVKGFESHIGSLEKECSGNAEGRANAAILIGNLGRRQEGAERMINAGVCPAFAKILKQGPMKVQAAVAQAVSALAGNYPKWQDLFAPYNVIRFLVRHLEFETIEGHNTEADARKATSMHAIVMMSNNSTTAERSIISGFEEEEDASRIKDSYSKWASEDPGTKAEMKAMAAEALSTLARGNVSICRSIAETRALLCFSILLDKGCDEIKYNCAMALLEITTMAEQDIDLKRAALKPSSLVYKALVDQLLQMIREWIKQPDDLLVLCIKVIGNLASTLRGNGIRMIPPLVQLLRGKIFVSAEAAIALAKFACTDNYLHLKHCDAIMAADGIQNLIELVEFGEEEVQIPALVLLCYICIHLPISREVMSSLSEFFPAPILTWLSERSREDALRSYFYYPDMHILAQAHIVVWWASNQRYLVSDEAVKTLVLEAKDKLQIYYQKD